MKTRSLPALLLVLTLSSHCLAQDTESDTPAELDVIKGSVGVWDAEFLVWANGPDADPIKFTGVETNKAHGTHWISGDLVSEFGGQTIHIHSLIGFDLEEKKLVGTQVDDGPYKATMSGTYDEESKTVKWVVKAKMPDGTPMEQEASIVQKSDSERVLTLSMPGASGDAVKFMQVNYVKREE